MHHRFAAVAGALLACLAVLTPTASARAHRSQRARAAARPLAVAAPDEPANATAVGTPPACTAPFAPDAPVPEHYTYSAYHCYTAQQMRAAYGVDRVTDAAGAPLEGAGQTIVLVDSYGSPTAAHDLQVFHDTFFAQYPQPDFETFYPLGTPDYKNVGNGQSGSAAAAGWAGEANLDVEWAYAMAPRAKIVLLATPPAETLGVQGFPNLFKAISMAIDKYPAGTIFSQSFGVTEETFGGAAAGQTARFDAVYKKGIAKGDTFLASAGDSGSENVNKQQRGSRTYQFPTVGWPASSPYVVSVGGTQLMDGWTWDPQSDTPFLSTSSGGITPNPAYFRWQDGGFHEPVWNESWLPAATGGGISHIYPRPSWQDGLVDDAGHALAGRGLPDVSWDAAVNGGALVYTTFFPQVSRPGWHVYGGTSSSSPQVAGVLALADEARAAAGKEPLGNAAPLLYEDTDAAAYRDVKPEHFGAAGIISGDLVSNRMFAGSGIDSDVTLSPVAGFAVRDAWDLATGFGAPEAPTLVAQLAAAG